MNWLAHIFLSEKEIDSQLGNLLADPMKGKLWPEAKQATQDGIKLHKKIDAFTDSHLAVSRSKSRLGKKGYLKPVVIDVVYDHFLIKHWDTFADQTLEDFIDIFYQQASVAITDYPLQAQQFVNRVIQSRVLTSYSDLNGIANAFEKMDYRLSPRLREKESMTQYIPIIEEQLRSIENDFVAFFPELISYTNQYINDSYNDRTAATK